MRGSLARLPTSKGKNGRLSLERFHFPPFLGQVAKRHIAEFQVLLKCNNEVHIVHDGIRKISIISSGRQSIFSLAREREKKEKTLFSEWSASA